MNWLKKLWHRFSGLFRQKLVIPEMEFHVFRPDKRILYRYFDGEKEVAGDPLALYKQFIACSKDLVPIMNEADTLAAQGQMYDKLITLLRKIFKLKAFEEGGLTDIEVLFLFDNFLEFCGTKKKESEIIRETLEKEMGAPKPVPPPLPPNLPTVEPGAELNTNKPQEPEVGWGNTTTPNEAKQPTTRVEFLNTPSVPPAASTNDLTNIDVDKDVQIEMNLPPECKMTS